MKRPLFGRPVGSSGEATQRAGERGVTIALVALAMMAIMAMAALSVDVVTLYLANAEAQRSADAAALAAARILSISGMTGDPSNTGGHWTNACAAAVQVATAVAQHNRVGSTAGTVNVSFPNNSDCTSGGSAAAFGVNPLVTVQVTRTNLPIFFARIWGQREATVGATATAEAFNSSNSNAVGNGSTSGNVIPVQPRCVKPWIVPNIEPRNACGTIVNPAPCNSFVDTNNGTIQNKGITIGGGTTTGVIGESFSLFADCTNGTSCRLPDAPPKANASGGSYDGNPAPTGNNLEYVPGEVPALSTAVPSCGNETPYQKAIAGCDQTTVYQCGIINGNTVDLSENPGGPSDDTAVAAQCLIHQGAAGPTSTDQDTLDNTAVFPFKILAGSKSPLGISGQITSSNSIVSLPIYDNTAPGVVFPPGGTTQVTIVGFLQVFINYVDIDGSLHVTVLNVSGCGNGSAGSAPVGTAVTGSSPVPVRLITYP